MILPECLEIRSLLFAYNYNITASWVLHFQWSYVHQHPSRVILYTIMGIHYTWATSCCFCYVMLLLSEEWWPESLLSWCKCLVYIICILSMLCYMATQDVAMHTLARLPLFFNACKCIVALENWGSLGTRLYTPRLCIACIHVYHISERELTCSCEHIVLSGSLNSDMGENAIPIQTVYSIYIIKVLIRLFDMM